MTQLVQSEKMCGFSSIILYVFSICQSSLEIIQCDFFPFFYVLSNLVSMVLVAKLSSSWWSVSALQLLILDLCLFSTDIPLSTTSCTSTVLALPMSSSIPSAWNSDASGTLLFP